MTEDSQHHHEAKFLGPEGLRMLWEEHHGSLDEAQQELFLARPEVPWITCIPAAHVRPAVAREKKLQRILRIATQSFEKEKGETRARLKNDFDRLRAEAEVFTVKKPTNPSRLRLN